MLKKFYRFLRLQFNVSKSEIYCSRISEDDLGRLLRKLDLKLRVYIGIPLVTKRPVEKDFDALILEMKAKVES